MGKSKEKKQMKFKYKGSTAEASWRRVGNRIKICLLLAGYLVGTLYYKIRRIVNPAADRRDIEKFFGKKNDNWPRLLPECNGVSLSTVRDFLNERNGGYQPYEQTNVAPRDSPLARRITGFGWVKPGDVDARAGRRHQTRHRANHNL